MMSELVNVYVMRHVYDIASFARNSPSSFVTISIVCSSFQFDLENMNVPVETLQRGSLDEMDAVTVELVLDGASPFILTLYVSVPASVLDSEVGIPPSPAKLFGLTQAD